MRARLRPGVETEHALDHRSEPSRHMHPATSSAHHAAGGVVKGEVHPERGAHRLDRAPELDNALGAVDPHHMQPVVPREQPYLLDVFSPGAEPAPELLAGQMLAFKERLLREAGDM